MVVKSEVKSETPVPEIVDPKTENLSDPEIENSILTTKLNKKEQRLARRAAEYADGGLFNNFSLAKQLAEEDCHGISIKKISKALNIPPQYLSKRGLQEATKKHLQLSVKKYVPEYGGIYIAHNDEVQRKEGELDVLRCRNIAPFLQQQQLILEAVIEVAVFDASINPNKHLKATVQDCKINDSGHSSSFRYSQHTESSKTETSTPDHNLCNLVAQQSFKYMLSCTIAGTFHVVVDSNKKYEKDADIKIVVTNRGVGMTGVAEIYAVEYKSFKNAKKNIVVVSAAGESETPSLMSESESCVSDMSRGTPRKRARKSVHFE